MDTEVRPKHKESIRLLVSTGYACADEAVHQLCYGFSLSTTSHPKGSVSLVWGDIRRISMSSLTINGIKVFATQDQPKGLVCPLCGHISDQKGLCRVCRTSADMTPRGSAPAPVVTPSFATHRLVDGNWVPKGSAQASLPTPVKPAIGFIQPAPAAPSAPKGSVSFLGSRKEYLRAIEIAAGHTLLKGTNQKAIDAIRRGRLGGRKDNMSELHALLVEYSA